MKDYQHLVCKKIWRRHVVFHPLWDTISWRLPEKRSGELPDIDIAGEVAVRNRQKNRER
jgi:hypothetical protein